MPPPEPVDPALVARLRAAADSDGFVPFDRFMDLALYAEGLGFYAADRPSLGPTGSFYTAAHVHPLFAGSIARRVLAVRRALGVERPFSIVEIGPGDGALAEGIVRSIGTADVAGGPLEYVLVERAEPLLSRARDRVARAARDVEIDVRVRGGIGEDGPFCGAVIANELLDAQPTRRLRWDGAGWAELGVRWDGVRFVPAEAAVRRPLGGAPLPPGRSDGEVVEVSPAAEALVREVADHLVRGLFVILDYGMEEAELRSGHPSGTLAAVRAHRSVDDPLDAPGRTDLSAFVNFSRVREAARSAGWSELSFERQSEALGRWGFAELEAAALRRAGSAEEEVRLRLAAKNLLFGFERFHVLELAPRAGVTLDDGVRPADRAAGQ